MTSESRIQKTEERTVFALSIRQPWAWLIAEGYKLVENRVWPSNFRGPFLIHASGTCGKADYDACKLFIDSFCSLDLPPFEELSRGGIVGAANMVNCIIRSDSPWFTGPYGFILNKPHTSPFIPLPGALRFFKVPKWAVPENFHLLAA